MIHVRKIKAFTISEMIVVLILTSIVVGLAFSVLNLVQKHMGSIQNNLQHQTEIRQLEQILWLDFNRYPKISYNDHAQTLSLANALDSTNYVFHGSFIVKGRDTFNLKMNAKTFYFDGGQISEGTIDALKLDVLQGQQHHNLFVFKTNDATIYMD